MKYIIRKGIYDFVSDNRGLLKDKVLDYGCGDKPYESIIDCDEYIVEHEILYVFSGILLME